MNILEIKNLNVEFEQYSKGIKRKYIKVIENLNLEVKQNELLAVFGASGSGKSILAHAILGLLPYNSITSGEIFYKGESLNDKINNFRGVKIAFIPQTVNSLNPILKIKEQMRINLSEEQIEEQITVFHQFNLNEDVLEKYPFELSGGMIRKILVCQAIISNADLIIADEPTPGMDVEATDEVIELFKKIKERGKSGLIITHDMEMAIKLCDRIAIFCDSKIKGIENTKDFSSNGEHLKYKYSQYLYRALPQNEFRAPSEEELAECWK